ncbi:AAA family ATPase [Acetatifactor muris]|uniref:AAA family ATPase n=1 Tax=Acetatifactor muris TaxID=879566 RepID=UPI0023F49FF5|nr:AAA family ATPase [Acetatifactor muris]MCI8800584.1 AAA family ATPase [Lachnospiraceae bacterium]
MARIVGIGIQNYNEIIEKGCFYIDKTAFIKEWWDSRDSVTLITRPRRFGKTLTMSMVEQFFFVDYAGRADLFEGLSIWEQEEYRAIQGTYPVISLSFANVKEINYANTREKICQLLKNLYIKYSFLRDSSVLTDGDREYFDRVSVNMSDSDASLALYQLSDYLHRYYGKKVIILLDEYDTPMQEAYVDGYWTDLVAFTRSLFNSTFKTNPWLERGIMTGITRVSIASCEALESIFSDLNNLEVVTTTSDKYVTSFGFTEQEVFTALEECGLGDMKAKVKQWYDGFTFGTHKDIYNPWSILNFLDKEIFTTHWANTSSNGLVGKLIRQGSKDIKTSFEALLDGERLITPIDEQIVYDQLDDNEQAIWSLLLASGYLKVVNYEKYGPKEITEPKYELELTNLEVKIMFQNMVRGWFGVVKSDYNDFIKALLQGDVDAMNEYMGRVAAETFSSFDTGRRVSGKAEPERFYHGFVLGLIIDLRDRYVITSNRESGFGRYDVLLEPLSSEEDAIIIEFKVYNFRREKNLEETMQNALRQIEDKQYETNLRAIGIPKERIRKYGFAFDGKKVLVGSEGFPHMEE